MAFSGGTGSVLDTVCKSGEVEIHQSSLEFRSLVSTLGQDSNLPAGRAFPCQQGSILRGSNTGTDRDQQGPLYPCVLRGQLWTAVGFGLMPQWRLRVLRYCMNRYKRPLFIPTDHGH